MAKISELNSSGCCAMTALNVNPIKYKVQVSASIEKTYVRVCGYSSHHWCVTVCSGSCWSVRGPPPQGPLDWGHVLTCCEPGRRVSKRKKKKKQTTKAPAGKQHKCFLSPKISHSPDAHIGKLEWSFNKQSCYSVVKTMPLLPFFQGRHGNFSGTKGGAALSERENKGETQISTIENANCG